MASIPDFVRPYPGGWQDFIEGETPITAEILNETYDDWLAAVSGWIAGAEYRIDRIPDELEDLTGNVLIANPTNGQALVYDASSDKWKNQSISSGGDSVSWNQILGSGTKIAEITINGSTYNVYAPSGSSNVSTLNDLTDVTLVSPSNNQVLQYNSSTSKWENKSISVGDTVSFTQIQSSGVKIGTITIDGTDYDIYAPQGGGSYEPNGVTYELINNWSNETISGQGSMSIVLNKYVDNVLSSTGTNSYAAIIVGGSKIMTVGNVKTEYINEDSNWYWVVTVADGYIQYNGQVFEQGDEIFRTIYRSDVTPIPTFSMEEVEESHSTVVWTQTQQSGTKIAEISIDGVSQNVYIPTPPANTSDLNNDSNFVSDASYVHTDNNYTTNEKNKLGDLVQVVANPSSGTSAGDLSSISIGGTKYDIPSGGGGGTTVVANPSGTATAELEKLQVGSTIYSIPEGGSGGGDYKDLIGTLTAGQTQITLSDVCVALDSTIDPYTDTFGVYATNQEIVAGQQSQLQPFVTSESELVCTVTADSYYSDFYPWKVFESSGQTGWVGWNSSGPEWIAFEFSSSVKIEELEWICLDQSRAGTMDNLQYSSDGTTWNNCTLSTNERGHAVVSGVVTAKYWRMYFAGPYQSWGEPMITKLQLLTSVNGVRLTFPAQSSNLGVKVRVS